jgi:hypothetical protein
MASESTNQPVRIVSGNGSFYTILLAVSALFLALACGLLLYWEKDVYSYFLFWQSK